MNQQPGNIWSFTNILCIMWLVTIVQFWLLNGDALRAAKSSQLEMEKAIRNKMSGKVILGSCAFTYLFLAYYIPFWTRFAVVMTMIAIGAVVISRANKEIKRLVDSGAGAKDRWKDI